MTRLILLVVIDCLRADHVSAYGYERETTPTIDGLAREGMLWEHAYSTCSWTRPAVTSMLTGLYPAQHGVYEGIKRNRSDHKTTTEGLSPAHPTLAEALAARGWRCGAFVNNFHLGEFAGLNRGFDVYLPLLRKADELLANLRTWLEQDHRRPAFAYLHFLEAHAPYKPRRRHVARFGGNRDTNRFSGFSARDFGKLRRSVLSGERVLSREELTEVVQMYDGAVRRLDGKVKILLHMLEELNLRDQATVVITSDHGEEFLEHGGIGHGHSLYEELTHVPLIAWLPDGPRGARYPQPVSQVALAPALLSAAEPEGGPKVFAGADLFAADDPCAVFAELRVRRHYQQSIRSGRYKLYRRFRFRLQDKPRDLQLSPWRLFRQRPAKVEHELYDLSTDREERANLAKHAGYASVGDALVGELDQWWAGAAAAGTACSETEVDAAVVGRLRDLGYLE